MLNSTTKSTIQSILRDNLPSTHRAFIFGSRSTDSHRKYSDIDLGITGNTPPQLNTCNRTSHTYNAEMAKQIFSEIQSSAKQTSSTQLEVPTPHPILPSLHQI